MHYVIHTSITSTRDHKLLRAYYTYGLQNLQAHFHFNSREPPHTIWPKSGLVEVHKALLIQIQIWTAARPCRLLANIVSESTMSGHARLPAPPKPNYSPLHTSYHMRLESWRKNLPWFAEPAPLYLPNYPGDLTGHCFIRHGWCKFILLTQQKLAPCAYAITWYQKTAPSFLQHGYYHGLQVWSLTTCYHVVSVEYPFSCSVWSPWAALMVNSVACCYVLHYNCKAERTGHDGNLQVAFYFRCSLCS